MTALRFDTDIEHDYARTALSRDFGFESMLTVSDKFKWVQKLCACIRVSAQVGLAC
jgi:hypothetical protein